MFYLYAILAGNFTALPGAESDTFCGPVIKNNRLDFNEIILNMAACIPFGLYVSMIKPRWPFWKKIIPAAAASLIFELAQYLFAIGGTDITDLLSNTLGGVAGTGLYVLFSKLFKEKAIRILNILAIVGTIGIIFLELLMMRFVTYRF